MRNKLLCKIYYQNESTLTHPTRGIWSERIHQCLREMESRLVVTFWPVLFSTIEVILSDLQVWVNHRVSKEGMGSWDLEEVEVILRIKMTESFSTFRSRYKAFLQR